MLNTFPYLLAFGLVAPLVIRLALGAVFIHAGYLKIYKKRQNAMALFSGINFPSPVSFVWGIGLVEILAGMALVAGFGTQIAAMLIFAISLGGLIVKIRHGGLLAQSVDFYIFALVMSLSLVFTGAGFFAVDLPL